MASIVKHLLSPGPVSRILSQRPCCNTYHHIKILSNCFDTKCNHSRPLFTYNALCSEVPILEESLSTKTPDFMVKSCDFDGKEGKSMKNIHIRKSQKLIQEKLCGDFDFEDFKYLMEVCARRGTISIHGRVELLKYLWKSVEETEISSVIPPAERNRILEYLIENDYDAEPMEIVKELFTSSDKGPNLKTYWLLAAAYAKKGDPVGTMKMAELVIQHKGQMDEILYNTLIQAFCKSGDMDSASDIFTSMRKMFPNPSVAPYNHFLNAYAACGDMEKISETLHLMVKEGVSPSSETFVGILDHLLLSENSGLLDDAWLRLEDYGLNSSIDFSSLIEKCLLRGQSDELFTVISKLRLQSMKDNVDQLKYMDNIRREFLSNLRKTITDPAQLLELFMSLNLKLGLEPLMHISDFFGFFGVDIMTNKETFISLIEHPHFMEEPLTGKMFQSLCNRFALAGQVEELVCLYDILLDKGVSLQHSNYYPLSHLGEPTSVKYQQFFQLARGKSEIIITKTHTDNILKKIDTLSLGQLVLMLPTLNYASLLLHKKEIQNKITLEFDLAETIEIISFFIEKRDTKVKHFVGNIMLYLLNVPNFEYGNEAFSLAKETIDNGIALYDRSFSSLLKFLSLSKDSTRFYIVVEWMKLQNVKLNHLHLIPMLEMAIYEGNVMSAQYCFDQLRLIPGNTVDEKFLLERIIRAYSKDSNRQSHLKLIQYYEEMISKGLSPDKAILRLYKRSQKFVTGGKDMVQKMSGNVNSDNKNFE